MTTQDKRTIVVVGNGMVGHRFCEKLIEFDVAGRFKIVTFCEESRAAYDRVGLTSFFAHRDAEKLMLARLSWYREHGIELHLGDRANRIDCSQRIVYSDKGQEISYDAVIMATGSFPFVPPIEGIQQRGVFLYRTIDDLERIIEYGGRVKRCAVMGGGLLGLEAAKAAYDLGLETHVVEFAPRLMPRQIDDAGSRMLVSQIEALGVQVHLNKATKQIVGEHGVEGILFADGSRLDVDMIIVSAGIRPRDDLGRESGLELGPRGGILVDDQLRTSDPNIYAVGEVALHRGMIYGLVAPGYEMAEIAAANLCGAERTFQGADLSTKLKLMGVGVASFGDYEAGPERALPLVWEDAFGGHYKKLFYSLDGKKLLGGILIGDTQDYGTLLALCKGGADLPCAPGELIVSKADGGSALGSESLGDAAQVCSCNNVTKGALCAAIRTQELNTIGEVKQCTRAGTGCGGCLPLITSVLNAELKAAGKTVNQNLCEHFAYTRQELYQIIKINRITNFYDLATSHGRGFGCEICKPAVASILASLWNDHVLSRDHQTLQDSNDRFLANVQRGGLYSIVPRVPGGEITPEKLIVLGQVAKQYRLYTKITGGQRIDLFGAQVHQLPEIWEQLIAAGFESGHAYGKALRTVKSCVGSTWCRYGVQDSVGFAIRVEERYRGIRAPHKLKGAVSGCIRECAEAQSKDFGLIATEQGYNLYVCGNGGSKPRHSDLLAVDLDEATALKYLDRFLMYYIQTADKLTRTSVWLENLPGGIDYLREVIIDDKLGIAVELEKQMQYLVDTYRCEWREVVESPERRRMFRQFVNSDETMPGIEMIAQRGQQRPADWPQDLVPLEQIKLPNGRMLIDDTHGDGNGTAYPKANVEANGSSPRKRVPPAALSWVAVGHVSDFPRDGGATIKLGQVQIAVFNFASQGQWYASQNMCPHKNAFLLSQGILGDADGVPKVSCPLHKKLFSLESGDCLSGEPYTLKTFPVKVEHEQVYLQLPPPVQLEALFPSRPQAVDSPPAACDCEMA